MTNLTTAIKYFTSLNRAPGAMWAEATKRKAPHKPILLLAVLDLVHRRVITSPFTNLCSTGTCIKSGAVRGFRASHGN
jgi:putative restriction endonuclease